MEYSFITSCKKLTCFLYSNDLFQEGALKTKNTKSPLSYTRLTTLFIFGFFFFCLVTIFLITISFLMGATNMAITEYWCCHFSYSSVRNCVL